MALILQAAQDYRDPSYWRRHQRVKTFDIDPLAIVEDALDFFRSRGYNDLCELLGIDPTAIPTRLGIMED